MNTFVILYCCLVSTIRLEIESYQLNKTIDDVEYIGETVSDLNSYAKAQSHCRQMNSTLPHLLEVKYFYKPVIPDGTSNLHNGSTVYSFYVNDVVEATPFHPDARQTLCFTIEKDGMKGSANIQIGNVSAEMSCSKHVNYLVCRRKSFHSTTKSPNVLEPIDERQRGRLCMQQSLFYALNVCLLIILLFLGFLLFVFVCKAHRVRIRLARLTRERHDILHDEWSSTGLPLPISISNCLNYPNNRTLNSYINGGRINTCCGNAGERLSHPGSCLLPAPHETTPRLADSRHANGVTKSLLDHQVKLSESFLTKAVGQSPTLVKHSNQASGFL